MTAVSANQPIRSPASFTQLMALLKEPDAGPTVLSPRRFGEVLGIDQQTLAAYAAAFVPISYPSHHVN